ncbi:hypothetical protein Tco_1455539 [Tanacetum coccineum]
MWMSKTGSKTSSQCAIMCFSDDAMRILWILMSDDAPTAQTLFMANLSSADRVYDEAGPSYDSDVLSEVQNHDHYQDAVCDLLTTRDARSMYKPNHVIMDCNESDVPSCLSYYTQPWLTRNPLCLHRARQDQPALYSGHVIVAPNHALAIVRDCEETLEQAEFSRKRMHDKMKANQYEQVSLIFPWPHRLRGTICSSVRTGDAIAGACSALAIDSAKSPVIEEPSMQKSV